MRHIPAKPLIYTILIAGLVVTGALSLWVSTFTIPDLGSFETRKVEQSTKIYDRTGEILLYDVHEDIRRTVIPFEDMSRNIKNATVAIEDDTFYDHAGIRPLRTLKAVFDNALSGNILGGQGGSTITQQVVKLTLLTSEKKISRKIKEWFLALKLEQKLSKDEILEIYLNHAPYGGSLYGIEEAARAFFGKSAADLSIAEAAYLAALPQSPTYYSPYGSHVDELEMRKNLVLERMKLLGFITEEEYARAQAEEVTFVDRPDIGIHAPHFVFYVLEQLRETYGERAIEEAGLKVTTTLDFELQQAGERIVHEYAIRNEDRFKAENASLVAIDPKTGEIVTMIGSRDYFDERIDGKFNVATASRQPGSAFKPFVYAAALEKGYTPETVVFDVPTQFSTACSRSDFTSEGNCYSPGNYDNEFRGPITFRNALAQSVNVPAVKVLYLAGITDSLRLAREMGISTLVDPSRYGLTLVLGGGEVKLLDITSAYGVFANDGVRNEATAILKVEDHDGTVLEEFEARPTRVLDENIARTISDMLSDNVARTPLYGSNSLLYFGGRDVAAKTGTTNDYRDAWTIGYTPNLSVGAWAGNNDNRSMDKQISGLIITPLWREFMDVALRKLQNESFIPPLPDDYDELKPVLRGEVGIEENNQVHSILHWVERGSPRGAVPRRPSADPQYDYWEYAVREWVSRHSFTAPRGTVGSGGAGDAPTTIEIAGPSERESYGVADVITIEINSSNMSDIRDVEYWIGDLKLGRAALSPFTFSFIAQERNVPAGTYTLKARAQTKSGTLTEDESGVTIR